MRRRSRRGQQSWHIWSKLLKLVLLSALVGAPAFYAYQTGLRLGSQEAAGLNQKVAQLTAAAAAARDDATKLAAALDEAKKRADDYQAKYEQSAVSDDLKDLLAVVRAKLAAGLDAKRLALVIQQAAPPHRCGETVTKRFMVRTGKTDGKATSVQFSDLITVTAQGAPQGGGAEAWYDPAKPVVVTFAVAGTVPGGKETQVEGTLPLQHSMVVKGGEFHFTITPGARGFVEVSGERCDVRG